MTSLTYDAIDAQLSADERSALTDLAKVGPLLVLYFSGTSATSRAQPAGTDNLIRLGLASDRRATQAAGVMPKELADEHTLLVDRATTAKNALDIADWSGVDEPIRSIEITAFGQEFLDYTP